ncbi:MAG: hypothetical protein H6R16_2975 [Proteobacteria bacterium]|nr:hypothetical protein [Pseudomonadota bacterium]
MNYHLRYLPLPDVTEGMVLGAPLSIAEKGVISFSLPEGHSLTETNLQQMKIRHAEFVCVREEDTRSDDERANAWAQTEARLQRIFRAADLRQPVMANLYEAVRAYRRT